MPDSYIGSKSAAEGIGLYPEQVKEVSELIESALMVMDAEAEGAEKG